MIPICDTKAQYLSMKDEIDSAVQRVMSSGQYIGGQEVESFEKELAEYLGVHPAHCVGVSSGTTALRLAMDALGIGRGDKVIVPSFTFFATAEVVSRCGATPVFVDVDAQTGCLDPDRTEEELKRWQGQVKAVIVVHLYGYPANMSAFADIGWRYGVSIIEDACQALGGEYQGRKLGTLGDFGCFSFFPSKNLGCMGDGGMVVAKGEEHCHVLSELRNHGRNIYGEHVRVGTNGRLDALQAAILRVKLPALPFWLRKRGMLAGYYREKLKGIRGISSLYKRSQQETWPAWNYFTIKLAWDIHGLSIFELQRHLKDHGIASQIYYVTPIHCEKAYADKMARSERGDLSITERLSREVLSLPLYPEMTLDQVDTVIDAVKSFFKDK